MSDFLTMRATLMERGFLRPEARDGGTAYRLTKAGHEHIDAMMDDFRGSEAPSDPAKPRGRGKFRRGGRGD